MGAYRYLTDCITGRRIWRWYSAVSRPERAVFGPCTRAAALAVPLAFGPSIFVPGAGPPVPVLQPVPPTPPAWHEGAGLPPGWGLSAGVPPIPASQLPFGEFSSPPIGPFVGAPSPVGEFSPEQVTVPEPSSLVVLAIGAGVAVLVRRRG